MSISFPIKFRNTYEALPAYARAIQNTDFRNLYLSKISKNIFYCLFLMCIKYLIILIQLISTLASFSLGNHPFNNCLSVWD